MRRFGIAVLILLLFLLGAPLHADDVRRVPFWPDGVPAAIQAHVDGVAVLAAVREIGKHHRVQGSPGLRAAAEWVAGELTRAGLTDARVESFPADGETRYAHFRSTLGWSATEGKLEEIAPQRRVIADYAEKRVALADYSQDADVTAELVDVGAGVAASDYEGKEVRGKLVLADGPLRKVHALAVEERGAAGFLSAFPNQKTAWSGVDVDQVRWGHLSAYKKSNRFAFMVSKRQAAELRARLRRGEVVRLRAHVRARLEPATYDILSATIPGSDPAAGDIVLTAHICHQQPGANDNASGSAALLGVARALRAAIAAGELPAPRRTLRFLWVPEISGSQVWLISHPELARRLRAGIHLDMVGGRPEVTHAVLHVSRSAASLPHVVNEIMRAFTDEVARVSTRHAEGGGEARAGMVWPEGSPEALVPDVRGLDLGSDHEVFEDSSFAVPMVYFHDWPDVTIHTDKDVPENLDATKLGRVAYMTAGIAWTLAALPDDEAGKLVALTRAAVDESLARARRAAVSSVEDAALPEHDDAALIEREVVAAGLEELATVGAMWPKTEALVRRESAALRRLAPPPPPRKRPAPDTRVPVRSSEVRGPVSVYYYDHIEEVIGELPEDALVRRADVLAYEALNLVDGKRSVAEIRDVLTGRIAPVAIAEVAAWLEVLERAKVIRWKPQAVR